MIEFISAIYIFWNYVDATNTFIRIIKVANKYMGFVKWHLKNPEIKIKYVRILTKEKTKHTIESIYNQLIENNKEFGDGFLKNNKELVFELNNSKLNYRIIIDPLNNLKENIKIETKYVPFYPLRQLKKLNYLTTEFNHISELISNISKVHTINHIIHIDIDIENSKKQLDRFSKCGADVIFSANKIQINNLRGTEQGEFILYFVIKWLTEYKES